MPITKLQRVAIKAKYAGCCAYCLLSERSATLPFHIDHIIPNKHGGSDNTENLCLACYQCNAFKGANLGSFDPKTGDYAPLFNPESQSWDTHFRLTSDMHIEGMSPEGRVTVSILKLNDKTRPETRRALALSNTYPCRK
jgi:hypothetical protein